MFTSRFGINSIPTLNAVNLFLNSVRSSINFLTEVDFPVGSSTCAELIQIMSTLDLFSSSFNALTIKGVTYDSKAQYTFSKSSKVSFVLFGVVDILLALSFQGRLDYDYD
jgi:hypothetical protein